MAHSPASSSSLDPLLTPSLYPDHRPSHDNTIHDADVDTELDDNDDLEALSPSSSSRSPYLEKLSTSGNARRRASTSPFRSLTRRPRLLAIAAILLCLVAFALFAVSDERASSTVSEANLDIDDEQEEEPSSSHPPQVRGPPTEGFWDNLRDDTQYITSWINAGWTNDFMTYVNLLYLAVLANRTAVLPPFAPSHLGSAAGFVDVGDVFDLRRLSSAIGVPIIQWSDLKRPESEHLDELGCWSIWATAATGDHEKKPRFNIIEPRLKLDVAYTPVPESALMLPRPQFSNDPHTRFFSLAALTFPDGRTRAHLPSSAPFKAKESWFEGLPDERMACFDFPYYVASEATFEFNYDWSPAWRFVGTHARWTPWMRNLAFDAIRRTLDLDKDEEIPPLVTIHVRHGDFGRYCNEDTGEGCFARLSAFARRVEEVKAELKERGVDVESAKVLVTSDETDPTWWEEVRALGWVKVDHEKLQTEERFGKWYTVFIDAVIQSLGAGFVGTDRSTMSLIAERRVRDWQDGVTREVPWGREGAD